MIGRFVRTLNDGLKRAALGAALFLCAPIAWAEDVTITSQGGALSVTGAVIGFDGTYLQMDSPYGPLTLRYSTVTCDGSDCPDPETYVPLLRLSGAADMVDVLMPALVEGFSRSKGYRVETVRSGAHDLSMMISSGDESIARISMRGTTSREGFADLITHSTDMALSLREVRDDELAIAREVGNGRLDATGQSRILGLDALVPVVSPFQNVSAISLRDLSRVYAGQIKNWAELGGRSGLIALHLLNENHGLTEMFMDEVMSRSLVDGVTMHADLNALTAAVMRDPLALGLASFGEAGNAKQMSLIDSCGLVAIPRLTTLKTEDYPLTAPLFLYMPERRLPVFTNDLLEYLRTPSAQLIVRRSGYVDQGSIPISLDGQGQRFATAIERAGEEVTLGELQRMIRIIRPRTRLSTSFRFEVGSTRLDAQSRSNLLDLSYSIRDGHYSGRALMLIGFSDGRGSALANRDLSSARAEAVLRDLLGLLGETLPDDVTIETEAFGEALPMGCDDTEWGRQSNRRVELWVAD